VIYLDNAATSYPKPAEVINAITEGITVYGANPGRSGHDMSLAAAQKVYDTREKLNDMFNGYGSLNVVFTYNCTYALNFAIKGVIEKGAHILTSSLEHNSVVRPLSQLKIQGICDFDIIECLGTDEEIVSAFSAAITPRTKLIVCTHASNVFGRVMPLEKLGELAEKRGLTFIVDAAQSAGVLEINMRKMHINCLCMPGHKGLYGSQGNGILLFDESIKNSLIQGGTGSRSFEIVQPQDLPDKLESGTLNVPGICSVFAGVGFIKNFGLDRIYEYEYSLMKEAWEDLSEMKNVILYSSDYRMFEFAPILAFNIKNLHSEQVAAELNRHQVAVRAGYHCAILAHKTYGTEQMGTVRLSPSVHTEKKDLNTAINYISKIAK
jgi:cysteine desulfurase family protein